MASEMDLLRTLLEEAGLRTRAITARRAVLAEDLTKVVMVVLFDSSKALLEGWEREQAWLVETVQKSNISVEKSWELYLVLACLDPIRQSESIAFDKVRRDVSLTRKIPVPGVATSSPASIANYLAPLRPVAVGTIAEPFNALELVEREAVDEKRQDVMATLHAFRENRPLFGGD